jgi:membrane protein required for colicin V production
MIVLDLTIIVSFVALVYTGYSAGLLREAIVLIAALVGVIVAGQAYDSLAGDINNFIDDENDALRIAFLSLIGAVVLVGVIISYVIKTTLTVFDLGSLESLGGALCGAAKGVILIQAVLIAFITFPALGMTDAIDDSVFGSLLIERAAILKALLPAEFDAAVDSI